jgi:hypothetical protein
MRRKTESSRRGEEAKADKVAASLRDAIHCDHRLASRSDAATDKTNPNDGRGQNPKTSFFHWKMNISSWRGSGEKTCFYETNPNGKIQDTWWQDIAKNANRDVQQNEAK